MKALRRGREREKKILWFVSKGGTRKIELRSITMSKTIKSVKLKRRRDNVVGNVIR